MSKTCSLVPGLSHEDIKAFIYIYMQADFSGYLCKVVYKTLMKVHHFDMKFSRWMRALD